MRVWISAGEVSGDRLAARVVEAMRSLRPDLEFAGIAGSRLRALGVHPFAESRDFSLAGWASVLPRLPRLLVQVGRLKDHARRFSPDLAILVDSPGLHRPFARLFRREGVPCAWVAPPQLWAWRKRTVPELQGMPCYPLHRFEGASLALQGARVRWYGFPGPRPAPLEDPAPTRDCLALFPGTRSHWKSRHLPLFRAAAESAGLPLRSVIAVPDDAEPGEGECRVSALLPRSAIGLALPGTGVLEVALAGVPVVVAAHPGVLDRLLARGRLVRGSLSLPNRILDEPVLPEHLGSPGSAELAEALRRLWERREEVSRRLATLQGCLGAADAPLRIAADLLAEGGVSPDCSGPKS